MATSCFPRVTIHSDHQRDSRCVPGTRKTGRGPWSLIRWVLAVVAASLLANLLIAWASAAFITLPVGATVGVGQSVFTNHAVNRWRGDTFDRAAIEWSGITAEQWVSDITLRQSWCDSARDALARLGNEREALPRMAGDRLLRFDRVSARRAIDRNYMWAGAVQDSRGWPLRAFSCEWNYSATGASMLGARSEPLLGPVSGGFELPARVLSPLIPPIPRALPFMPIWSGLLLNTLAFSSASFVVMAALSVTRRLIRRCRNVCPRCAYSLAGQSQPGCPECGWKRSTAHTPDGAAASLHSRSSVRVWAIRVALALLGGVVVTLLVAAASAYFVVLPSSGTIIHSRRSGGMGVEMTRWRRPGAERTVFVFNPGSMHGTWDRLAFPDAVHDYSVESLRMFLMNFAWPGPGRTPAPAIEPGPSRLWAGVIQDARGWPMRAFWCEWSYDPGQMRSPSWPARLRQISGGFDFTPKAVTRAVEPNTLRAFPYRPIWFGLAMNTLFYATVFALIFAGIAHVRTRRRLRRNLCLRCGYSLAGQASPGCPECGWNRAKSPESPAPARAAS